MNKLSCQEYQKLIGNRIKQYRVNAGVSQKDLENESGVSVRSISRLEQGASVQLESLIKILSALNLESNIELLIPDQTKKAILSAFTADVSFNMFAAEVQAHAIFVVDWKSCFDKWYSSAIRADMAIGEEYESGMYDDYYDPESDWVQNQIAKHGEY